MRHPRRCMCALKSGAETSKALRVAFELHLALRSHALTGVDHALGEAQRERRTLREASASEQWRPLSTGGIRAARPRPPRSTNPISAARSAEIGSPVRIRRLGVLSGLPDKARTGAWVPPQSGMMPNRQLGQAEQRASLGQAQVGRQRRAPVRFPGRALCQRRGPGFPRRDSWLKISHWTVHATRLAGYRTPIGRRSGAESAASASVSTPAETP